MEAEFLRHLEAMKFSEKSVVIYREGLEKFLKFLKGRNIERVQDANFEVIDEYRRGLVARNLKTASISTYMNGVVKYFGWLESSGKIFVNPCESLRPQRISKTMQFVATEADVKALLAQPDVSTAIGVRNRAMFETAYSSACRISELASLEIGDADFSNGLLLIRQGKGAKDRVVPIGRHAVKWLKEYMGGARMELLDGAGGTAMWIGTTHRKIGTADISMTFKECSRMAGLARTVTVHSMRRSVATQMLRNGASPALIAEMLGHADLSTLGAYLQVPLEDIRKTQSMMEGLK